MRSSKSRLAIDLEFISSNRNGFALGLEEVQTSLATVQAVLDHPSDERSTVIRERT